VNIRFCISTGYHVTRNRNHNLDVAKVRIAFGIQSSNCPIYEATSVPRLYRSRSCSQVSYFILLYCVFAIFEFPAVNVLFWQGCRLVRDWKGGMLRAGEGFGGCDGNGVLIRDSLWAPGIRVPKSMFRSRRACKSSSVCKGSEMGAGRCIPMPA
jgi:hypothetical protein